uniref:C3H1-type domain-containing protein n=1 Tax=Hyaloperonospora arabidopsidis (strain Emoy2) TaxID=559515 RepID=M4BJA9_HYAAE
MKAEASLSITSDKSSAQTELNEEVPAQMDPKVEVPSQAKHQGKTPLHFDDEAGLFKNVCRTFMRKKCTRVGCTYVHDKMLCQFFWKRGECKFGDKCRKNHFLTQLDPRAEEKEESAGSVVSGGAEQVKKTLKKKKNRNDKKSKGDQVDDRESTISTPKEEDASNSDKQDEENDKKSKKKKKHDKRQPSKKNTESFEPMTKPVDLRITFDLGSKDTQFSTPLTSRDVVLVPNLFSDYRKGELYTKLLHELDNCGIPREQLLKMWHGNDKIDGTHLIVDDRSSWKAKCPTFDLVTDRLKKFFNLDIKATRFNWYKDTSQWKPFHFDAAAVKPHLAGIQNFTVGISFGATRDAAFEHAKTKTVVSVPQPDGCVYAFSKDTNVIWRHGILQDVPVREEGRISVIAWGWMETMTDVAFSEAKTS